VLEIDAVEGWSRCFQEPDAREFRPSECGSRFGPNGMETGAIQRIAEFAARRDAGRMVKKLVPVAALSKNSLLCARDDKSGPRGLLPGEIPGILE
jgi:hypothetical protein